LTLQHSKRVGNVLVTGIRDIFVIAKSESGKDEVFYLIWWWFFFFSSSCW